MKFLAENTIVTLDKWVNSCYMRLTVEIDSLECNKIAAIKFYDILFDELIFIYRRVLDVVRYRISSEGRYDMTLDIF